MDKRDQFKQWLVKYIGEILIVFGGFLAVYGLLTLGFGDVRGTGFMGRSYDFTNEYILYASLGVLLIVIGYFVIRARQKS